MYRKTPFILAILAAAFALSLMSLTKGPSYAATKVPTAVATAAGKCNMEDVYKEAKTLEMTGQYTQDMGQLMALQNDIANLKVQCDGFTFKGTRVAKLIGPFFLAAGKYKFTATTPGFLIIEPQLVSGSCDTSSIFNLGTGEGATGAETIYESTGCNMYLKPSNISAPWTLTIEPLGE